MYNSSTYTIKGNTMSKAKANAILKSFGLANIKLKTGELSKEITYRDANSKMVKGILFTEIGPLHCFLNVEGHRKHKLGEILDKFRSEGFCTEGTNVIITSNSKKRQMLCLLADQFQTYCRSANLDPAYKSHYFLPVFYTETH